MAIRLSGLVSNMDTESIIKELMSAQRMKATKIENKKTRTEWKQEIWKDLNKKLYSFYTGTLSDMKMQKTFNTKAATSSDASKVSVTASTAAVDGTHTIKVTQLASAQFVTGAKLGSDVTASTTLGAGSGNITVTKGTKTTTIAVDATTKIGDFVAKLKDAGINASFDTTQKRLYMSSKDSGSANAFSLSADSSVDLSKIGLSAFSSTDTDKSVTLDGVGTMSLVAAKDALFEYNGASMTSSSNSISANGLSFNLLATTGTSTISIGVTNDTQAVYDKVKAFVKEYNEILKELNDSYYANTAKGYEPLTDEQKEAMSEDQVEKWESKIKDSLLRRDNTISSLITTMRTSLSGSITYNDKGYALSTLGIRTSVYTEKGLLHIKGDKDDSTVSSENNDLMTALTENPDAVMKTMNELAGKLYSSFTDSMKSNSLRSALTFYNDKEYKKNVDDYKDELSRLEDKLSDIESRYYKQFSAMETAMSKMNSQSSSLVSMLGSGG